MVVVVEVMWVVIVVVESANERERSVRVVRR